MSDHILLTLFILWLIAAALSLTWDRRKVLWSVLCGRPTAYRLTILDGTLTFYSKDNGYAQELTIRGNATGIRVMTDE